MNERFIFYIHEGEIFTLCIEVEFLNQDIYLDLGCLTRLIEKGYLTSMLHITYFRQDITYHVFHQDITSHRVSNLLGLIVRVVHATNI